MGHLLTFEITGPWRTKLHTAYRWAYDIVGRQAWESSLPKSMCC